jgi:hypothetical protein
VSARRRRDEPGRVAYAVGCDSDLTAEEQAHARTALRFLRSRCGTWEAVARVLRFNGTHIVDANTGRASITASMAVRIARVVKAPIDDVLTGRFPAPNTCPHCGHVGPTEEIAAS